MIYPTVRAIPDAAVNMFVTVLGTMAAVASEAVNSIPPRAHIVTTNDLDNNSDILNDHARAISMNIPVVAVHAIAANRNICHASEIPNDANISVK